MRRDTRLYWGHAVALARLHRAVVGGVRAGVGGVDSLHQEGPQSCRERSSEEADGQG